jgi:putative phage-type endonuclease
VIIHDVPQRSEDWFALRCGRLTASRACDMAAQIKSGEAAARRDLRAQLVCERLTGQPQEDPYTNATMQRGIDKEPDALTAYEMHSGSMVLPCGFLAHDTLLAGCSPDGQINGYAGILELKCPKSATHLTYLKAKQVPRDYLWQITHALWISGAEWCDFASFDDRFPAPLQLLVLRVKRGDVDLKAYDLLVRMFLAEVDKDVEELAGVAA